MENIDNTYEKLNIFMKRMEKLKIDIKLGGNIPWIYLEYINGKRVKEEDYYMGNHGFTIGFCPIKVDKKFEFTDIKRMFQLIKKYK